MGNATIRFLTSLVIFQLLKPQRELFSMDVCDLHNNQIIIFVNTMLGKKVPFHAGDRT